jgi:hypothetical protein
MMHRLDRTIAIADDLERTTDTGLVTATGSMTEMTEEEEEEEAGIHTAAPAQEQAKRARSSSKAEAT